MDPVSHEVVRFSFMNDHEELSTAHRPKTSSTIGFMQLETLEQIAERLGWTPERLAQARARELEPSPLNITDRDRARAEILSKSMKRTRRKLDELS